LGKNQFKKKGLFGDFWSFFGKIGRFLRGVLVEMCRVYGRFGEGKD
jgi:hypothetical protein